LNREPLTLSEIMAFSPESTLVWCTPSLRTLVASVLPQPLGPENHDEMLQTILSQPLLESLIVIGGGTLIDRAKIMIHDNQLRTKLIPIPSIWGSGAELSPIAVRNTAQGSKEIRIESDFTPVEWGLWPDLAEKAPDDLKRWGTGDTYSHAMEAFLSPIGNSSTRKEAADILRLLILPGDITTSDRIKLSGRASLVQSRCSVGLVHGMAHALEPILSRTEFKFGHARLCSAFLYPVMMFNTHYSPTFSSFCEEFALSQEILMDHFRSVFSIQDYSTVKPLLKCNWITILRDRCSRTNCTLVKREHLDFFLNGAFNVPSV
jgi:hypothetical protein